MKVTVHLRIEHPDLKSWCEEKGLKVTSFGHNMYDIENVARYGKSEHEIIEDFCCCLEEILPLAGSERDSASNPEIPDES